MERQRSERRAGELASWRPPPFLAALRERSSRHAEGRKRGEAHSHTHRYTRRLYTHTHLLVDAIHTQLTDTLIGPLHTHSLTRRCYTHTQIHL